MAMSKEQILKGIERAEAALSRGTLTEGAKANLMKQVTQMKSDLAALEKETEKKEEKIEKKEQEATDSLDAEIAKCEAVLRKNPKGAIKEVFEKKLQMAKQKKADLAKEAKEDKAEAKQELKEVKEAVKDIEKAVASGTKAEEPIKKPKIEEKKRAEKSKKRVAALQTALTSLTALVQKNKELKDLYDGKRVDLKRDAGRPAKPFGYRFTGKGKNAYRVPTPAEIKAGKKRGTIDYEGRPNRSDKYPKGFQGNVREKLADGGIMADGGEMARGGYVSKGELVWKKLKSSERMKFLYENFTPEITPRGQEILVGKDYNFLPKNVKNALQSKYANVDEYADGGMMAKGGEAGRYKIIQDTEGTFEQGFYGVFDTKYNTLINLFQFKSEAQGFLKEIKEKGLGFANVAASEYNGQIQNYINVNPADGGFKGKLADGGMMAKGGKTGKKREKISYEAIDFHNAALKHNPKKKKEKYTWDAEEDKMTGEREGERKAGMDEFAKGGKIGHRLQKFYNEAKESNSVKNLQILDKDQFKFICKGDKDCRVYIEYNADSDTIVMHQKYSSDGFSEDDDITLEQFKKYLSEKMAKGGKMDVKNPDAAMKAGAVSQAVEIATKAYSKGIKASDLTFEEFVQKFSEETNMSYGKSDLKLAYESMKSAGYKKGGKLIGNQSRLDMNKNGRLDKEDFEIIRGEKKMAKGAKVRKAKGLTKTGAVRKNSKHRFCWTKDAVKDGIIKKEQLKDIPTLYHRKTYPAYIMEK